MMMDMVQVPRRIHMILVVLILLYEFLNNVEGGIVSVIQAM